MCAHAQGKGFKCNKSGGTVNKARKAVAKIAGIKAADINVYKKICNTPNYKRVPDQFILFFVLETPERALSPAIRNSLMTADWNTILGESVLGKYDGNVAIFEQVHAKEESTSGGARRLQSVRAQLRGI